LLVLDPADDEVRVRRAIPNGVDAVADTIIRAELQIDVAVGSRGGSRASSHRGSTTGRSDGRSGHQAPIRSASQSPKVLRTRLGDAYVAGGKELGVLVGMP
jgi:hypothetical protein